MAFASPAGNLSGSELETPEVDSTYGIDCVK